MVVLVTVVVVVLIFVVVFVVVSDDYIFSLLYDGTRVFGWLLRFFVRCVLDEGGWES